MKKIMLPPILLLCVLFAMSQQKTTKPATASLPKLTVKWGNKNAGDLTVAQVQQLVDSPLVALDEKGTRYAVTAFRINYTFMGSYKDEETGQIRPVKDFRAYDVDHSDRLTDPWKESVRDNAKKGDEILFNKILVRMKNGKQVMGPDLRYSVK